MTEDAQLSEPTFIQRLRAGNVVRKPALSGKTRAVLSVAAVAGTTVLSSYMSGALTVALPSIGRSLPLAADQLQWPVSMLSLTNGAFLLIGGGFADAFGRRPMFLIGTAWLFVVSLIAGFAPDAPVFILMCALLGMGNALLTPSGVGILGASLPDGTFKDQAFAALGAGQPIGFIIGLILGGILSKAWHVLFFVHAGLAVLFAIMAWAVLPNEGEYLIAPKDLPAGSTTHLAGAESLNGHEEVSSAAATLPIPRTTSSWEVMRNFDWIGAATSTTGLILLTFALADAGSAPQGWRTPYIPTLLPVSAMLLGGFVWWQRHLEKAQIRWDAGETSQDITRRPKDPLLPPGIWRAPKFGAVLATVFTAWLSFNTLSYESTLMYQEIQHTSPIKTSVFFMPMFGVGLLLNVLSGYAVSRFNAAWLMIIGILGGAASTLVFVNVEQNTPYMLGMFWVMALIVSTDLAFPPAQIFACRTVGRSHSALAGSLFNTTVRLGSSFGLAITSTIASTVTREYAAKHKLLPTHTDALLRGYRVAGWICFGASMTAVVLSAIFLRDIGVVGGGAVSLEAQKAERGRVRAAKKDAKRNKSAARRHETSEAEVEDEVIAHGEPNGVALRRLDGRSHHQGGTETPTMLLEPEGSQYITRPLSAATTESPAPSRSDSLRSERRVTEAKSGL